MINPLKCLCGKNNNTTITIKSKCFLRPIQINLTDDDSEKINLLKDLLEKLLNNKNDGI